MWNANSIRLTFIFAEQQQVRELAAERILETEASSRVTLPTGEVREEALGSAGKILFTTSALRADYVLVPSDVSVPGIPSLGNYGDVITRFTEASREWIPRMPSTQRLAFGAGLFHAVSTVEEAHCILAEKLPRFELDFRGADDFLLQINRPTHARAVDALRVNRLAKWMVHRITGMVLSPAGVMVSRHETVAAGLELDISTAADRASPLPADAIVALAGELAEHAMGIATTGDPGED